MRALFALLLFATTFPTNSRTSWMRPEAFHLVIGMSRAEAMSALEKWTPKPGKTADELIVDYSENQALTLLFSKGRLTSVRFELFVYLPEIRFAFDEEKARLAESRGKPRKATKSILIYDNALPNVMVVAADDPNSAQGKQGIGVLAVRYYDPR
jgi:hypothetical protein